MSAWKTAQLAEVAEVFNGKTPSKAEQRSEGHPVLKIKDVNELGEFRGKFDSFVDPAMAETFSKKRVRGGDTLILNAAHNAAYVASKTYRTQPATVGALATGEWLIVRANEKVLDADFVHHWVDHARTRSELRDLVNGIHLYPKDVGRLRIPLPGMAEQRRIAAALNSADALRAKRRDALAEIDRMTEAIFLDLFGDSENGAWPVQTIEAIAHSSSGAIRTGPFGSQLLHGEFVDDGVAVLGIDNAVDNEFRWGKRRYITEAKYQELRRYTVKPGDVLITIMGTCGRCAVIPDSIPIAINTKHLCCITLDQEKCLPIFLHAYFLHHPLARRYLAQTAKGAIMAGLNMSIIKKMPIRLPPLADQREFARRTTAVDELKAVQRSSLVEIGHLVESLQYRAFRGEL